MRPLGFWHTPPRLDPAQAPHAFGGSPEEVRQALGNLSLANRYFGGTRSLLAPLRQLLSAYRGGPVRLLDVGCGRADQPRAVVEWARRQGVQIRVVAVDRDGDVARRAAGAVRRVPEISLVQGDALELPFRPRTFDYVTSSMLLHYFSWEEAGALLRSWASLSSQALVVNDIERHWFPCAAISILARLSRSSLFQDGSRRTVLRGFTPRELQRLAATAGFAHVEIRRHFPFRLALIIRTGSPDTRRALSERAP